ncbi:MAG TPA: tetratricopeptide repeat protein [Candidatus Polarisedimenticolaceae bacterium]
MSTERADQLHQQASEHYLQGEYAQAIAAWRQLLELDPANEQALEGVRMSALLSEGDGGATPAVSPAAPADATAPAPDFEIDLGLKVFDSIPKPGAPARPSNPNETMMLDRSAVEGMLREGAREAEDAPERLSKPAPAVMQEVPGFDFGDLDDLSAIPLAAAPGVEPPSPGATDAPVGAFDEGNAEAVGLAPVVEEHRPHVNAANASAELVKRVQDLLAEARAKVDAGEREEALGILARVFILDEENAEARQLEAQIELAAGTSLADIETHLIEGVQAFDQGRHEEAKVHFRAVLDAHPEHREALHYLEKIQEQEASFGDIPEDLLASAPGVAGAPVASPPESVEPAIEPAARPKRPSRAETPVAPAAPAMPTPSRRSFVLSPKLLGAVVGLAVLGAAAWFVPKMLSADGGTSTAAAPPTAAAALPRPAKPAAPPAPAAPAPAPVPAMTLDQAMAKARTAMAASDYGAAVIAYKAALDLDKTNIEALEGIRQAGDAYKAQKAEQEQFDRVAMAFKEGEFASGLRLLYRLPPTVDRGRVDRYKADGWFNLGVVALRAGDVSAAIGHFEDALAIRPDPDATKWRSFAQRYRDLPKDRGFYDAVEAIPFRQIE